MSTSHHETRLKLCITSNSKYVILSKVLKHFTYCFKQLLIDKNNDCAFDPTIFIERNKKGTTTFYWIYDLQGLEYYKPIYKTITILGCKKITN